MTAYAGKVLEDILQSSEVLSTMNGVIDKPAIYPSLEGRSVFITGGGSGIGESLVEHFCRARGQGLFRRYCGGCLARRGRAHAARPEHPVPHFIKCDLRDIEALRTAIAEAGRPQRTIQGAGEQCRQRRPPYDRERHSRLLGQPHAGQPAPPVLRRTGSPAADARCGRRLHHQFRLDHMARRRSRLPGLCDGQVRDRRPDPRAWRANWGQRRSGSIACCPAG